MSTTGVGHAVRPLLMSPQEVDQVARDHCIRPAGRADQQANEQHGLSMATMSADVNGRPAIVLIERTATVLQQLQQPTNRGARSDDDDDDGSVCVIMLNSGEISSLS